MNNNYLQNEKLYNNYTVLIWIRWAIKLKIPYSTKRRIVKYTILVAMKKLISGNIPGSAVPKYDFKSENKYYINI